MRKDPFQRGDEFETLARPLRFAKGDLVQRFPSEQIES